jgi:hypothetical protein
MPAHIKPSSRPATRKHDGFVSRIFEPCRPSAQVRDAEGQHGRRPKLQPGPMRVIDGSAFEQGEARRTSPCVAAM